MSVGFRAVQWNPHKLVYDLCLVLGVALFLGTFMVLAPWFEGPGPRVTFEIERIRALGSCAFLMVTLILTIGPLARLDRRFLAVLYNRRHFGVTTFLVALCHALAVLDWYYGQASLPPLVGLLSGSNHWSSLAGFPFEIPGILALVILFVMAATSHDFWLAFLGPARWKGIHMAVYGAFALLVMHVALGVLQSERSPFLPILLVGAVVLVSALHLAAGRQERGESGEWIPVGRPGEIEDGRAIVVTPLSGERIAVFRDGHRLSAVSNVCAHQNGPLGEGRIVDGCITCPWHGFQYRPEDGCSPPPFHEKIPTYRLRLEGDLVLVETRALPAGTPVPPLEF